MFVFDVVILDRMQFVPEGEPARDHQSDENADQEKQAIRGQRDQQNGYHSDGDDEARRSFETESRPAAGFRFHDVILTLLFYACGSREADQRRADQSRAAPPSTAALDKARSFLATV